MHKTPLSVTQRGSLQVATVERRRVMSMIYREMLFGSIRPALTPLFDAYMKTRADAIEWVEETLAEIDEELRPHFSESLNRFAAEQLHAIAGCLVLLADNFAKAYVLESGLSEDARADFGLVVANGVKFGGAILAGGNALRHSANWNGNKPYPQTAKILADLGITRLDDSVCFQILELDKIRSQESFIARLDAFCGEVDEAVRQGIGH